jgi:hypothetical protein
MATSVLELRHPGLDLLQPIRHHPPDVFVQVTASRAWEVVTRPPGGQPGGGSSVYPRIGVGAPFAQDLLH